MSTAYRMFYVLAVFILIDKAAVLGLYNGSDFNFGNCKMELFEAVKQQFQELQMSNENLRLKLNFNDLRLDTFLDEQKRSFGEIKTILTNQQQKSNTPDSIDVRFNDASAITYPDKDFLNTSTNADGIMRIAAAFNQQRPNSCAEVLKPGDPSGLYQIYTKNELRPFYVYCLQDPQQQGPAWTIFQRRQDGSVDFQRTWTDYKYGFGKLLNEHFLGLEKLHALTNDKMQELWIQMEDFEGGKRYAKYSAFAIGDENTKYTLNILGDYTGDAGDSLSAQSGQKFTTKDQDNDPWAKNCAVEFTGAWWHNACHVSNLNGQYLRGTYSKDLFAKGIVWQTWKDYYYALKYVHMAIRPKA